MSDNDPTATMRYQLAVEDLDRRFPRMVPVGDGALCHRTYRDPAVAEVVEIKDAHGHTAIRYTRPHPNDPLAPAGDGLARVVRSRTARTRRT